ncbi:MAG TPA: S49 family peptidase, partial [Fibrobacteria bacterium]|nr:S49 family peptidase [Fibrobacteria bacterium]
MRNITTVINTLLLSSAGAVGAWDAPLPFLAQPSGNDLAAFGNPAAATRAEEAGTGFFLGRPDSLAGPWDRAWTMHHQENGQAFGLQLLEGSAKTQGTVSWSAGHEVLALGSTGIRASYLYREAGRDRLRIDLGAQLRPHPSFQAGYWVEDFLAAGDRVHRMSAALRPMPAAEQRLGEVSIGYGMDLPEDGRRAEFLFAQSPLPGRVTAHARYEFGREVVSLGLTWQMTGQAAAAWGLRGPQGDATNWRGLKHREAGLRFRKAAKPGFAWRPGPSRRVVAELDLNHSIVEGETPQSWLGSTGDLGHLDLLRRFDVLEADPSVRAVALKLGRARAGWGIGEEIRGRILRLRARGKRVVAYMEQATPLNYYLASAADVVAVQPGGHFAVTGFSSEMMFYRGLFDKVGVEPQFLRHGKYKSFEEPYTRKDMSPEARADLESFQGSLWGHYLEAVSASRGLTRDSLARVLSAGEISLGPALRSGLVDTLVQEDEVLELAGGKGAGKVGWMPESIWRGDWEIPPRVAVVVVQGDMV